jgi:uncharacterized repeat protein (TIGR01451 family)
MFKIDRVKLRTILASSGVTVAALAVLLLLAVASDGIAQSCTDFVVTSSASNANWTDVSGLWTPAGSYPGRDTSCDTASDTSGTATVIVVNTAIPNPITGLNLSCSTPGCVIDIQPGGSLTLNGPGTIGNGSKLRVSGGTLTIAGGTLTFQNGALYEFTNGTVDIQSGGTIDFTTGSSGTTTGGVMGGAGTLSISGGTLNIGSVTSPATFSLTSGGVLDGPGFLSVGKTLFWDSGTITGSGGTELAGGGNGTLSGAGPMNLNSRGFNNYGHISYAVDPAAGNSPLTLNGNAVFSTYGTFDFTADGSILGGATTSFGVFPNGFLVKSNGAGNSTINPPTTNDAVIEAYVGTMTLAGSGTHHGWFIVDSKATIVFAASSTVLINASVFGAGNVAFPSGTSDIDALYDIEGQTSIGTASVTFESFAQTTDFLFNDAGSLGLIGDFVMIGNGTWSAGTMQYDDGAFLVDTDGVLTIDAANGNCTVDTAVINNEGTINYTAGTVLAGGVRRPVKALFASSNYLELSNNSTINNDGLFDIQTDAPIVSSGGILDSVTRAKNRGHAMKTMALRPVTTARGHVITHRARTMGIHASACICTSGNDIENYVTLQKSAAAGTTDFGPNFGNHGDMKALSGTINFQGDYFQDDGATTLGPGNIQSAFAIDIEGGIIDGTGTITGDVDNYGTVKPGTATTVGTINVTGNFEMGASPGSGAVTMKIAGDAAFDQLNITGTATLDATFNGSFIGGYTPPAGTTKTWPVITYAGHGTSQFTTVNSPTYYGGSVTYAYNPTSFDLTAFTPTADVRTTNSGPATANTGDTLTYTVNVSNLGPQPTSGTITVTDSSTGGATPVGGSAASDWTCSIVSGSIQCTTASTSLANGASLPPITFTWTAPASPGMVVNTASVPNSLSDPVSSNNSASVTTAVGPQANLSITKTVVSPAPPNPVNPGQNITYSIVVQNNGPAPATGVTVNDPTPTGLAFLSVTGSTCTSFPCSIGTLNPGQSVTLTSMYNVPPSYSGGAIVNTASVSEVENDPNIADNQSTTTTNVGAAADVAITKNGPPAVSLGQNITYTIGVSNFGPAGATGVTVSDTTPAGLTPVSVSGGGCSARARSARSPSDLRSRSLPPTTCRSPTADRRRS